ncbi:MAG: head GIN domain-containing protein [Gilvibacter sp.]
MKTLMKATILVICVLFSTNATAQWGKNKKIKGNGNVTTDTRSTSDYDGVSVVGPMDVFLVKGSEGNISIEADSNFMEYLEVETDGDMLVVRVKKGYNLNSKNPIKITVPFNSIDEVKLVGSGDVMTKDTINTDSFEASLVGSGDVVLDVVANETIIRLTGSGDMDLSGSAGELEMKLSGSGDIDGDDFKATNAEVYVSGSGDINVNVSGNLKARVNGSGDIHYSGNPTVDKKVSGSGDISGN